MISAEDLDFIVFSEDLMDVYETDANTLLNLEVASDSIDAKLKRLPVEQRQFLMKSFDFMIEQALRSA